MPRKTTTPYWNSQWRDRKPSFNWTGQGEKECQLALITAERISLKDSSDKGFEKSTPLISAVKVGWSCFTIMLSKPDPDFERTPGMLRMGEASLCEKLFFNERKLITNHFLTKRFNGEIWNIYPFWVTAIIFIAVVNVAVSDARKERINHRFSRRSMPFGIEIVYVAHLEPNTHSSHATALGTVICSPAENSVKWWTRAGTHD